MSLLRRARTELGGAWRSLRYDLGRRPAGPPADGPDMTSTGMNTFGTPVVAVARTDGPDPARRPRRAVTAGALGVLTVVGAAGAYLGVVNGLGSLVSEYPAAADTFPARPAATSDAQIGTGPAPPRPTVPAGAPAVPAPIEAPVPPAITPKAPAAQVRQNITRPVRTKKPTSQDCRCGPPPVPTPTAPASAPSPTPSTSASSAGSPSPSASPSDSAEPSDSPQARHRRHRR